ncbi:MAG: hypothetical protein EAZ33_16925 [Oscillatoriales cyanobacterium]|nr:MAG: hypothetical protein EAZ33_16925 [Oscillatoriales cyanobacterium]
MTIKNPEPLRSSGLARKDSTVIAVFACDDWWLGQEVEKTKPQVLVCGSPGCSQQSVNSLRANLGMPKIKIAVGCEHR